MITRIARILSSMALVFSLVFGAMRLGEYGSDAFATPTAPYGDDADVRGEIGYQIDPLHDDEPEGMTWSG